MGIKYRYKYISVLIYFLYIYFCSIKYNCIKHKCEHKTHVCWFACSSIVRCSTLSVRHKSFSRRAIDDVSNSVFMGRTVMLREWGVTFIFENRWNRIVRGGSAYISWTHPVNFQSSSGAWGSFKWLCYLVTKVQNTENSSSYRPVSTCSQHACCHFQVK